MNKIISKVGMMGLAIFLAFSFSVAFAENEEVNSTELVNTTNATENTPNVTTNMTNVTTNMTNVTTNMTNVFNPFKGARGLVRTKNINATNTKTYPTNKTNAWATDIKTWNNIYLHTLSVDEKDPIYQQ